MHVASQTQHSSARRATTKGATAAAAECNAVLSRPAAVGGLEAARERISSTLHLTSIRIQSCTGAKPRGGRGAVHLAGAGNCGCWQASQIGWQEGLCWLGPGLHARRNSPGSKSSAWHR